MPHFSESGNDTYICQVCAKVRDSVQHPSTWRPDLTGSLSAGNICPDCRAKKEPPLSLAEHCRKESGGLTGQALQDYINRHYGHG